MLLLNTQNANFFYLAEKDLDRHIYLIMCENYVFAMFYVLAGVFTGVNHVPVMQHVALDIRNRRCHRYLNIVRTRFDIL